MSDLAQRQEAVRDVTATLMDWFPNLAGLDCERIAKLAVAACDRAFHDPFCDRHTDGGIADD